MSRSSLILAIAGGALATLAVQGAAGDGLDAARLVAGVAVIGAVGGGSAGAAWYWFRTRSDVRTAAAIAEAERRRHRAERSRQARAQAAAGEQAHAEALAAERDARPVYVDPYLTPAGPEAVDETHTYTTSDWEDLYAHTVGALSPEARRYASTAWVSATTAPPAAP